MNGLFDISEALSIALHLCVRLAQQPDRFCSTRTVAEEFDFSSHHVAKVVQKLVRGGVVETVRGIQGGARLKRKAAEITLMDIAEAIGEPPPEGCLLSKKVCSGKRCLLGRFIHEQSQRMSGILRETTLQTIADSLQAEAGASRASHSKNPGDRDHEAQHRRD